MGVTQRSLNHINSNNKKEFLNVQAHWGHHKKKLDLSSSKFFLGTRNNFCVVNTEYLTEYYNRAYGFCSDIAIYGGIIGFFNPVNNNCEDLNKIVTFFGYRSLQPIQNFWVAGGFTNKQIKIKKPDILIVPSAHKNVFILRETSQELIPVITKKDSNTTMNKISYPVLSNDDSIESYHFFYSLLSNVIIQAYLSSHAKKILS